MWFEKYALQNIFGKLLIAMYCIFQTLRVDSRTKMLNTIRHFKMILPILKLELVFILSESGWPISMQSIVPNLLL